LSGLIEEVVFFNEENGFAVIKVKAKGIATRSPSWLAAVGQRRRMGHRAG